ncbi:MAG: hypothetical protein WA858_00320, partial [Xanthobacteraceae bacterium]
MGEFPADGRADLRQLLGLAKPVEPRHQRSVQASRHRPARRWNCGSGEPHLSFGLCLQHRLGHLLDEQGNAIGALDDVLPHARGQRVVADEAIDQRGNVAFAEPVQRQGRYIGPPDPGRLEFRPVGDDHQNAGGLHPFDAAAEHLQARRIDPIASSKIISIGLCSASAKLCAVSASK